MKLLMFVAAISVLTSNFIKDVTSMNCLWNNSGCQYKYYSSKTPYENIRGDIRDSILKPKGCKPISVWAILRHGRKNPGAKFLKDVKVVLNFKNDIILSYENGNSSLCAQDVENIKEWKIDKSFIDEPNEITKEGYQETVDFARRLKEALPELLNDIQEKDYLLRPVFGPRTGRTTKAFIEGLGNKDLFIDEAKSNFSVAYPYGSCKKYLKEVFSNPNTYNQANKYMKSAEFRNMKCKIERKLGLNFTLTDINIIALYDLCRYTSGGNGYKTSPWCAIFSDEDLKVLEYVGDLEHYWRSGYAVAKYSKIFGQIPLADLFKRLEQAKKEKGKKIVVYFTHSSMMDMIVVTLNLYKDARPISPTYRDPNRKWRSTFTSTFGANMIAVLNRCQISDRNQCEHKIAFYRNERPIVDLCNNGLCSWQEFEEIFKPFLNATTDFCNDV